MREQTNQTILHSYPGLLALITSKFNDKVNVMAAGWHTYLSYDPPIYGVAIGKERYTYDLVKSSGEFAVNFLPVEYAEYIMKTGKKSGRDENKLEGIDYTEGKTVQAPIFTNAYIAFECKVTSITTYGDHDFFVANITQFYEDKELFLDNGLPDLSKLRLPLFLGQSQFINLDKQTKTIKVK